MAQAGQAPGPTDLRPATPLTQILVPSPGERWATTGNIGSPARTAARTAQSAAASPADSRVRSLSHTRSLAGWHRAAPGPPGRAGGPGLGGGSGRSIGEAPPRRVTVATRPRAPQAQESESG
jgi:hypothetical protein